MAETVIGTYNMSFASDRGYDPIKDIFNDDKTQPKFKPSEGTFLRRNEDTNKRAFWENAFNHLKDFIETKGPLAVGLQEMIVTENAINYVKEEKAQPRRRWGQWRWGPGCIRW